VTLPSPLCLSPSTSFSALTPCHSLHRLADSNQYPKEIEIYERMAFSLNDFVDPNQLVKRRGRHFRQIEEVECTPDGQYALLRCSDMTVILYRSLSLSLSTALVLFSLLSIL
jgi:hypothetical protein